MIFIKIKDNLKEAMEPFWYKTCEGEIFPAKDEQAKYQGGMCYITTCGGVLLKDAEVLDDLSVEEKIDAIFSSSIDKEFVKEFLTDTVKANSQKGVRDEN